MLNHIVIMGRFTKDPVLRHTGSQIPVTSFTLAVDRDRKGEDGSYPTDFIDCVAWRSTAEHICNYFTKGSMAVVCGRLQIRDWVDNENNKRRTSEIVVENIYFGESKRRDSGYSTIGSSFDFDSASQAPTSNLPEFDDLGIDDGELPF